jgi:hypothetical protein
LEGYRRISSTVNLRAQILFNKHISTRKFEASWVFAHSNDLRFDHLSDKYVELVPSNIESARFEVQKHSETKL